MLRNSANVRRCSYFELGLPVLERAIKPLSEELIERYVRDN